MAGIVAGSYGEIFFGNCTANGMPCLVAEPADVDWLLREVEKHPTQALELDVERQEVRFMGRAIRGRIPEGARKQLVDRLLGRRGRPAGGRGRDRAHRPRLALRRGVLSARRPGRGAAAAHP